MAQINRLDCRIDQLAKMLEPARLPRYEVELLWIQPDGSVVDDDGNTYVPEPGVIMLDFSGHGHSSPD